MRGQAVLAALLATGLSGCVAASVATTAVSTTVGVAGTAVRTTASVVGGAADLVTGGGDE